MQAIFAIIIKEIKLLLRDPGGLIMLFILPAIFILVLSVALQGAFSSVDSKEKMNLLVINEDKGNMGKELIDGLGKVGYFNIIEKLNGKKLTIDDAKNEITKGKYKIAIVIPEKASEAVNFKTEETISIFVDPVLSSEFAANITNAIQNYVNGTLIRNIADISANIFEDISKSRITELDKQINLTKQKRDTVIQQKNDLQKSEMDDNSKMLVEKMSSENIKELTSKIKELEDQKNSFSKSANSNEELVKNKYNISGANAGIKVSQIYYSANEKDAKPNSVQQNVPGWTIFALFWIVQLLTINILIERQSGVFKRILISPISKVDYIIGKIIPFFIINIIQAIFMFLIGIFILPLLGCPQLEIKNIFGLCLMTFAISLTAISLGLFIATIAKSIFLAASASALVLIILTVIGGIMVPKIIMPAAMQKASLFVPQGWALDGYLNILVKNYTVVQILPNVFVLLGFSLVFFLLGFFGIWRMAKNINE